MTDAISHTKEELQPYFDQTKSQVMNQITGKTNKCDQSQTMSIEFQLSNIVSFAKLHIFFLNAFSHLKIPKTSPKLQYLPKLFLGFVITIKGCFQITFISLFAYKYLFF